MKKLTLKDLGAQDCINLLNPIKCPCGCGGYAEIVIGDDESDNVFSVAGSLLEDVDCGNAWIFIMESWAVSGAYTTEDGIQYFSTAIPENEVPIADLDEQIELIKNIINDVRPHCIGVLQQTDDGTFRVVMDKVYDR